MTRFLDPPPSPNRPLAPDLCRILREAGALELPPNVTRLLSTQTLFQEREQRTIDVRGAVVTQSESITDADFDRITPDDLAMLFAWYDREVFHGCLSERLAAGRYEPMRFRLSTRLRSSGAMTEKGWVRRHDGRIAPRLGIAVSVPILRSAFADSAWLDDPDERVVVVGLECYDRLDVLLRVFEHELIHVFEFLVLGRSSCKRLPFKALSRRLFDHQESTHRVVPLFRRAAAASGWRPGDRVHFDFRGATLEGVINRITRRATVLVEDTDGTPYTNGGTYRKYYVPLGRLSPVATSGAHRRA